MSAQGNIELNKGIPKIKDAFVVIVKTEWNAQITDKLEEGCIRVLNANKIGYKVLRVPGAFELPYAIRIYAERNNVDAFVALGAVVRGDTPHFDYVCRGVTDGIMQLNLQLRVPVIFAVLTVDNEQQAIERLGGTHGHKGEEAAVTAIKMIGYHNEVMNPVEKLARKLSRPR